MPGNSFESTQEDIDRNFEAIKRQASGFGLDTSDPFIVQFIEWQAKVSAAKDANIRFLQNIIHAEDFENVKSP